MRVVGCVRGGAYLETRGWWEEGFVSGGGGFWSWNWNWNGEVDGGMNGWMDG